MFLLDIFFIYISNAIPLPGFPPSRTHPITSSLSLILWGCSSTHPPTPTSLPSIPLPWDIYRAFLGPRTSTSIDAWQGQPMLHMQLEPCVLLCWWLSPWESWGIWLVDNVGRLPDYKQDQHIIEFLILAMSIWRRPHSWAIRLISLTKSLTNWSYYLFSVSLA
jgi:hypothetical protein